MAPPTRDEMLALAATDVRQAIPEETLLPILSQAPFVPSRSLVNMRDAGAVPGSVIPAGRLYRSGTLEMAANDPEAVAWLAEHVRAIFDLRGDGEREKAPDPAVEGVENVWHPTDGKVPPPDLSKFAVEGGVAAWGNELLQVALCYKPAVKAVLEYVRDNPGKPFLIHCTAGRDRTGVVTSILQALAGTSPDDIVYDYVLSRLGTEPARDKLVGYAMQIMGITDMETPGFVNLCDIRPSFWHAFNDIVKERYGGWDGYVEKELGMSADEIETIKKNLRS